MRLKELAEAISTHLKRFEEDPLINVPKEQRRLKPYFRTGACVAGRYVSVTYVSFQGPIHLTKDEAERYLARLNEGFIGRHFAALRETAGP